MPDQSYKYLKSQLQYYCDAGRADLVERGAAVPMLNNAEEGRAGNLLKPLFMRVQVVERSMNSAAACMEPIAQPALRAINAITDLA